MSEDIIDNVIPMTKHVSHEGEVKSWAVHTETYEFWVISDRLVDEVVVGLYAGDTCLIPFTAVTEAELAAMLSSLAEATMFLKGGKNRAEAPA
jgi:hypothetical protein